MEFIKLPKSDFPELMQDEMQVLLDTFYEATGKDICKEAQHGNRLYKYDVRHPINALVYALFYEGSVYKITSLSDLISILPTENGFLTHTSVINLKNSILCSLENLAKYYGSSYNQHPLVNDSRALTDEAIIAAWRLKIGM